MKKQTIKEWEEALRVNILDYDGFDRQDPNLFEKKISKDEFQNGLFLSTIQLKR